MTTRPRHIPHWLFALFMRIKEPRSTRLAFFCIYLILLLGGSSAFTGPPTSIDDTLGAAMTILWGVFFIAGGILGASSVLRGSWWVERVALFCSGTGFAMYAVVITILQIQLAGPYLMQLCLIVFALIILTLRWTQIRRYAYDPEG